MLRSGGIYTPEWVYALKRGIGRHLSGAQFRCLTDAPGISPPTWRVPLEHHWRGWWSKMELFRPRLFPGPVLYVDLDTLPVGDLTPLTTYRGPLAMLSDFYRPEKAQSGVMAFTPGAVTEAIWEAWIKDPEGHMRRYRGDGEWLHALTEGTGVDRIQDVAQGVYSLKVHAREGPPEDAVLVCGHGNPRLSSPAAGWAHGQWRALA